MCSVSLRKVSVCRQEGKDILSRRKSTHEPQSSQSLSESGGRSED